MDTVTLFLNRDKRNTYTISNSIDSHLRIKYEVGERIASGGNSVVHKCIDYNTGNEYAIKFLLTLSSKMKLRFEQEIKLLKEVKHDHLIKYIDNGIIEGNDNRNRKYNIPFLIMPLAETNLLNYVKSRRPKPIPYAEYIPQFKGLSSALDALHEIALHRDIKPENILIIGDTWVLSDFGLCKFIDNLNSEDISGDNEHIGPRYWMSPESLNQIYGNEDEITKISDIFQLCCIFWFIVTGRHPTGILTINDWIGPENIFYPIYESLHHDSSKRLDSGSKLCVALQEAAISS